MDLKIKNSYLSQFWKLWVGWSMVDSGRRCWHWWMSLIVGWLEAIGSCWWRLSLVGLWWILDNSVIYVGRWCSGWLMILVGQCWSMCMRFIRHRWVGTSPGQGVCVSGSYRVGEIKILWLTGIDFWHLPSVGGWLATAWWWSVDGRFIS